MPDSTPAFTSAPNSVPASFEGPSPVCAGVDSLTNSIRSSPTLGGQVVNAAIHGVLGAGRLLLLDRIAGGKTARGRRRLG